MPIGEKWQRSLLGVAGVSIVLVCYLIGYKPSIIGSPVDALQHHFNTKYYQHDGAIRDSRASLNLHLQYRVDHQSQRDERTIEIAATIFVPVVPKEFEVADLENPRLYRELNSSEIKLAPVPVNYTLERSFWGWIVVSDGGWSSVDYLRIAKDYRGATNLIDESDAFSVFTHSMEADILFGSFSILLIFTISLFSLIPLAVNQPLRKALVSSGVGILLASLMGVAPKIFVLLSAGNLI